MKKNLLTLLLLSLIALSSAFAQSRTISGKITGADDGQPLPGVSIRVQGSTVGTQTNNQGEYSITLPSGARAIVLNYIGYATQTITIGSQSVINVKMITDSKAL